MWLSYFCKLQWAAGLAAPVFPRGLKGEYWLSCFVIQMPNVPPAKQLPPVTVLNRAALSLSLAPLHRCPPCLFSKRRFALVLFFLSVCCCPPSLCSFLSFPPNLPGSTFFFDLVLFITVLCFHRLPLFYFLFPPSFSSCSLSFTSFSWCVASLSLFAFSQGKLEKDKGHKEYNPIMICRLKENRWNSPMSLEFRKFNEGDFCAVQKVVLLNQ